MKALRGSKGKGFPPSLRVRSGCEKTIRALKPKERMVKIPFGSVNAGSGQTIILTGQALAGQARTGEQLATARVTYRAPSEEGQPLHRAEASLCLPVLPEPVRRHRELYDAIRMTLLKVDAHRFEQMKHKRHPEEALALAQQLMRACEQLGTPEAMEAAAAMRRSAESLSREGDLELPELFEEDYLGLYRHHRLQERSPSQGTHTLFEPEQPRNVREPQTVAHDQERVTPRIEYFALRLLCTSVGLNQPLKSLCDVVQLHELSHLLTQLGLDSDLDFWRSFDQAEKVMVEGSAQALTLRAIMWLHNDRWLRGKSPKPAQLKLLECFHQLCRRQSAPYRMHERWATLCRDDNKRRLAFQLFRASARSTQLADFEQLLLTLDAH